MKKNNFIGFITLLSMLFVSSITNATITNTALPAKQISSKDSIMYLERLYEIKSMDMSTLNSVEKNKLKKEVKSIEKKMKLSGGGLYISAGALIIIILLLILFI